MEGGRGEREMAKERLYLGCLVSCLLAIAAGGLGWWVAAPKVEQAMVCYFVGWVSLQAWIYLEAAKDA